MIAINDDVDTAEEDWDDRLHEAARHHAKANKYTSRRIKRKLEGLWHMNAAIGLLRPGYRRTGSKPATATEPAEGPYFDHIDPPWQPVIREAFERIARNEPASVVGQWLTEKGLRKYANSKIPIWTDKTVIALITNPIYRGEERYRETFVHKKRRSGAHRMKRNASEDVLIRPMPHLRMVEDWLWYAANDVIKGRTTREVIPNGLDHPLTGIPRDSRGPLSKIFFCVCGAKMHVDGRTSGGYRCSKVRSRKCNNRASPLCSVVHAKLGNAIANKLLSLDGHFEVLCAWIDERLQDDGCWTKRKSKLIAEEQKLVAARDKLLDAIENAEDALPALLERMHKREEELARNRAEQKQLEAERSLPRQMPNKEQIRAKLQEMTRRLLDLDRTVGPDLQRLVGRIRAAPYQQFGTTTVVLRAHFDLNLVAFLPDQLFASLKEEQVEELTGQLRTEPMVVDLFDLSRGPAKFWSKALELDKGGHTSDEIAKELGTNRATANRSVRYGKALMAAGLTDPFVELKEIPPELGRWRKRPARPSKALPEHERSDPDEKPTDAGAGEDHAA